MCNLYPLLRTPEEFDLWLSAPTREALALQKPLPAEALQIVAKGERQDALEGLGAQRRPQSLAIILTLISLSRRSHTLRRSVRRRSSSCANSGRPRSSAACLISILRPRTH